MEKTERENEVIIRVNEHSTVVAMGHQLNAFTISIIARTQCKVGLQSYT